MPDTSRPLARTGFALVAFAILAAPAAAQDATQRPIRLVVAVAAGGTTDIMARNVGGKLAQRVGPQVVIDNRPGASGIIGVDIVVRSQPDGNTLLFASGSLGTVNALYPKAPFDVVRDLTPIGFVGTSPYLLVVQPSLPVKSVAELVAHAKARPGSLNFAGSTPASLQRLAGELLNRTAGIDMLYIPYKGTGALMPDLLGGRLQVAFDNVMVLMPYVKSGTLRALAVTSAKRSPVIPDLPSIAEGALPGFNAVGWFGVFGAAKTPAGVVARLNGELNAVMRDGEVRDRLLAQGAEPHAGPPDDLRKYLANEIAVWGKLIRELNLKSD
jgi:tripartite-type tricarboxylate transporter receptor subunit TctC